MSTILLVFIIASTFICTDMFSAIFIIFFPLVWGALPLRNSTEDDYNWESFLTFAKSSTNSVIRSFLPVLVRNFSEVGLSYDCENNLLKLLFSTAKWKTWALKSKFLSFYVPHYKLEICSSDLNWGFWFNPFGSCILLMVHVF